MLVLMGRWRLFHSGQHLTKGSHQCAMWDAQHPPEHEHIPKSAWQLLMLLAGTSNASEGGKGRLSSLGC